MYKYRIVTLKRLFIQETAGFYLKDLVVLILLSALIFIVPGIILSKKRNIPYSRFVLWFLTFIYAGIIFFITIFRRPLGYKARQIVLTLNLGFDLHGITNLTIFAYAFLNVILFVPWGSLLYLFRRKEILLKGIVMTTLMGFLTSFTVECVQLITETGLFEITDLVTNTTGTLIGAIICGIITKIISRISSL